MLLIKLIVFGAASAGASDLLRQQNSEKMNVERELLNEENRSLSTKIQSTHDQRQQVLDEAAVALAHKLQGETSSQRISCNHKKT